jgi:hypothetical protein
MVVVAEALLTHLEEHLVLQELLILVQAVVAEHLQPMAAMADQEL